jgi:parvulin-like peptidyl-prolyl isomerase
MLRHSLPLLAALSLIAPLYAQDAVIARVGDNEIKADQIKPFLAGISQTDRDALTANPALLSQTVRTLILQQILFKEALAAGWDKNADVVAQIERLRQVAIAESYLASIAKVPDGYPSDADIQTAYDARKDSLIIPKQFRIAQIYIAAPQGDKAADEKAKTKIDAIAKSLKAPGADFAAVARDQSEERESATRGGEVGWIAEASLQPEIRAKVSTLSKGGTSDPIRLTDGWYVVRVLEVKDPHTATLDEIRDRLVAALRADRIRQNREAYISKIQQQNPVAIDELGLSKLLKN